MRKTVQNMAYARFQYEQPSIQAAPEQIEMEALVGEVTRGGFLLTSSNEIPLKGFLCSSHPRMTCVPGEFEGMKVTAGFEFDGEGLSEGDVVEGTFTVIYNGGELSLPFTVTLTKFYGASSVGTIRTLTDFTSLARASWEEAYRIFTASFFPNILRDGEEKERLLYEAVGASEALNQGMEEFLIGAERKQRISFELEETQVSFDAVAEDSKETFTVRKDGWGYLEISLTSDSPWLVPVREQITSADFVGNQATVECLIVHDKLHGGKNMGRLTFTSLHQKKELNFTVRKLRRDAKAPALQEGREQNHGAHPMQKSKSFRREKRELLMKITRLYLDFRMGKIVTGVWTKESCICLERLKELEPDNLWRLLYHAQALLINKQRQEARWLIDAFLREPVRKDSPLYAYYLYLCTLEEQEPGFVAKTFGKIRDIYQANQEDMRLFFIMLFLEPELGQSRSRKLSAIKEKVMAGMHSPMLYMEAYCLLQQDTYLLKEPGDFEMLLLHWAAKEGMLTAGVAAQVGKCTDMLRRYHSLWYEILKACYQAFPTQELLTSLCGFCIKWGLVGKEQFAWYQEGVEEELRIAGLYEAWLDSAAQEHLLKFPRSVMIYFQYQNSGNDKKQALLYASIIRKKELQPKLYESYRKQMEHFTLSKLMEGCIDENLAILYEEFVTEPEADSGLSEAYQKVADTYKLVCQDEHATGVVVSKPNGIPLKRVPLVNHQAYLSLPGERYCILMEDERGIRYLPKEGWRLERLMEHRESSGGGKYIRGGKDTGGERNDSSKEQMSLGSKLVFAEQKIMELDGEPEDKLTALCAWIYREGVYTERILWYLCRHFRGNLKEMASLWRAAREFDLDTFELEERFLTQLVYTRGNTKDMEAVFLSHFGAGGREMVLMACLSYFSYQYFVKELPVEEEIFACMKKQLTLENPLNDCCKLACFRWLCEKNERTEEEERLLEELLETYAKRRMYFGFYEKLPGRLRRKHLLHDRVFLEYRTNPAHRVTVEYTCKEFSDAVGGGTSREEHKEADMENMFEGIFVKPLVLFCDEELSYCIREERQKEVVNTERGTARIGPGSGRSSYDFLNQMADSAVKQEQEKLKQLKQRYLMLQKTTEEKFQFL